jgi:hypothetical protein
VVAEAVAAEQPPAQPQEQLRELLRVVPELHVQQQLITQTVLKRALLQQPPQKRKVCPTQKRPLKN